MKKLLFIVNNTLAINNGVSNKILSQVEDLSILFDVDFMYLEKNNNQYNRIVEYIENKDKISTSILKNHFLYKYDDILSHIKERNIDVVYMRYTHFCSLFLLNFFDNIKRFNKDIKIVLEIPNYPYDLEYSNLGLMSKLKLGIDKYFRNDLEKNVDCILSMSSNANIFGVKNIKISNAISSRKKIYLNRDRDRDRDGKNVRFVSAANISSWHGYDRIIKSIAQSNKEVKSRVSIDLIGDGKELNDLIKMSINLGVENIVHFHGAKDSDYIFKMYQKSDIGIDSLARHRSGNLVNDSIKSKEYIAYGLPIIMSHSDLSLDGFKFVYKVPSVDTEFDFKSILNWYDNLSFTRDDISEVSKNKFTWLSVYKRAFEELEVLC